MPIVPPIYSRCVGFGKPKTEATQKVSPSGRPILSIAPRDGKGLPDTDSDIMDSWLAFQLGRSHTPAHKLAKAVAR